MSRDLITKSATDIIREMAERGEIGLAKLREVHRAQRTTDRVEHHKDKSVYETIHETVEIFYFD